MLLKKMEFLLGGKVSEEIFEKKMGHETQGHKSNKKSIEDFECRIGYAARETHTVAYIRLSLLTKCCFRFAKIASQRQNTTNQIKKKKKKENESSQRTNHARCQRAELFK
jgi:hypothetical protein